MCVIDFVDLLDSIYVYVFDFFYVFDVEFVYGLDSVYVYVFVYATCSYSVSLTLSMSFRCWLQGSICVFTYSILMSVSFAMTSFTFTYWMLI